MRDQCEIINSARFGKLFPLSQQIIQTPFYSLSLNQRNIFCYFIHFKEKSKCQRKKLFRLSKFPEVKFINLQEWNEQQLHNTFHSNDVNGIRVPKRPFRGVFRYDNDFLTPFVISRD